MSSTLEQLEHDVREAGTGLQHSPLNDSNAELLSCSRAESLHAEHHVVYTQRAGSHSHGVSSRAPSTAAMSNGGINSPMWLALVSSCPLDIEEDGEDVGALLRTAGSDCLEDIANSTLDIFSPLHSGLSSSHAAAAIAEALAATAAGDTVSGDGGSSSSSGSSSHAHPQLRSQHRNDLEVSASDDVMCSSWAQLQAVHAAQLGMLPSHQQPVDLTCRTRLPNMVTLMDEHQAAEREEGAGAGEGGAGSKSTLEPLTLERWVRGSEGMEAAEGAASRPVAISSSTGSEADSQLLPDAPLVRANAQSGTAAAREGTSRLDHEGELQPDVKHDLCLLKGHSCPQPLSTASMFPHPPYARTITPPDSCVGASITTHETPLSISPAPTPRAWQGGRSSHQQRPAQLAAILSRLLGAGLGDELPGNARGPPGTCDLKEAGSWADRERWVLGGEEDGHAAPEQLHAASCGADASACAAPTSSCDATPVAHVVGPFPPHSSNSTTTTITTTRMEGLTHTQLTSPSRTPHHLENCGHSTQANAHDGLDVAQLLSVPLPAASARHAPPSSSTAHGAGCHNKRLHSHPSLPHAHTETANTITIPTVRMMRVHRPRRALRLRAATACPPIRGGGRRLSIISERPELTSSQEDIDPSAHTASGSGSRSSAHRSSRRAGGKHVVRRASSKSLIRRSSSKLSRRTSSNLGRSDSNLARSDSESTPGNSASSASGCTGASNKKAEAPSTTSIEVSNRCAQQHVGPAAGHADAGKRDDAGSADGELCGGSSHAVIGGASAPLPMRMSAQHDTPLGEALPAGLEAGSSSRVGLSPARASPFDLFTSLEALQLPQGACSPRSPHSSANGTSSQWAHLLRVSSQGRNSSPRRVTAQSLDAAARNSQANSSRDELPRSRFSQVGSNSALGTAHSSHSGLLHIGSRGSVRDMGAHVSLFASAPQICEDLTVGPTASLVAPGSAPGAAPTLMARVRGSLKLIFSPRTSSSGAGGSQPAGCVSSPQLGDNAALMLPCTSTLIGASADSRDSNGSGRGWGAGTRHKSDSGPSRKSAKGIAELFGERVRTLRSGNSPRTH